MTLFWIGDQRMRMVLVLMLMFGAALLNAPSTFAQEKPAADSGHAEAEPKKGADEHASPATDKAHAKEGHDTSAHAAGGHDAGGHDASDLSHANAGPSQNKPEEWKYDLAIWTLVVFFLLVAILGKFAWGPISAGLEKREHSIESMISDAKRNQDEAKALLANYETKLAASQEEIREMYAQARREAEGISAKIVADAQAAAGRERERAVAEIDQAKNAALSEVAAKSVDIAMGLAGKIVRRQITGEDHRALLHEAVDGIASRN